MAPCVRLCFVLLALLAAGGCREVPVPPIEVSCADTVCAEGRCAVSVNGVCRCDGSIDWSGRCLSATPCFPNPCVEPFLTQCIVEEAAAVCVCDPGHVRRDALCEPIPVHSCPGLPSRTADELDEPDDCPQRAIPVGTDGVPLAARRLEAGGDVDWYRVEGDAHVVYELRVLSSGPAVIVDVFGADGTSALASDHAKRSEVRVRVMPRYAGPMYFRVQAADEREAVDYEVAALASASDDFPDALETARPLAADTQLSGGLQFSGDVDTFRLAMAPGSKHEIALGSRFGEDLVLTLRDSAGQVLEQRGGLAPSLVYFSATGGEHFLSVSSARFDATGGYSLYWLVLGADDHADTPDRPTDLPLGPGGLTGELSPDGDVDAFRFVVAAGGIYRLTCTGLAGGNCSVRLLDQTGASIGKGPGTNFVWRASADGVILALVEAGPWPKFRYRLVLVRAEDDDHGDVRDLTATRIAPGDFGTARYDVAEDLDVLRFEAVAGRIYSFSSDCEVSPYDSGARLVYPSRTVAFKSLKAQTIWLELRCLPVLGSVKSWKVEDLGPDDHADQQAGASPVQLGTTGGVIELASDTDWFVFDATADRIYEATCHNCTLVLHDVNGLVLGDAVGSPGPVAVRPSADVRLFLAVKRGFQAQSGSYALELADAGDDDHPDVAGSATPFVAGAASGRLQFHGDADLFSFDAVAGRFHVVSDGTKSAGLSIEDAQGKRIGSSTGFQAVVKPPVSGRYFVRVGPLDSYRPRSFVLSLTDAGADDHGDSAAEATALPGLPSTGSGKLQAAGDVDVFAFSADAGQIVQVGVTPVGSWYQVLGPTNSQVVSSNQTATFAAPVAGSYYLVLDSSAFGAVQYSWSIQPKGFDDHGDDAATATPRQADGSSSAGSLETAGDLDIFVVALVAGRAYGAGCFMAGVPNGCTAEFVDALGTTQSRRSGEWSYFHSPFSGSAWIRVKGSGRGAYTLVVSDAGADDHGVGIGAATLVSGSSLQGKFETPVDEDWFAVDLASGTWKLSSTGAPYSAELMDSGGQPLWSGTSGSPLAFQVAVGGRYHLRVVPVAGSAVGPYTITLQR